MFIIENDTAIWGCGETEEAAWQDMQQWVDTTDESYSDDDFRCVQATPALIALVKERGGNISWGKLPDGTRCTNEEEEYADSSEKWYKFTAFNATALYGFGTEAEVSQYEDYLNRNREINLYHHDILTYGEAVELRLEGKNTGDLGFNLADALDSFEEQAQG